MLEYLTRENYGVFYHDWGNYGRGKYGEISPKPPIFPGHNFTCDFCFVQFFLNSKRIYSFLSVPDEIMGGENMAKLVQNRQFFPVIILPVTSASYNFS